MVASYTALPDVVANELTECTLTREQLVLHIQSMNPTATAKRLARFSSRALGLYLAHLQATSEPRGRMARWIHPGETPAILAFEASDDETDV